VNRGVFLLGCLVAALATAMPAGAGPLRTGFVDGSILGPQRQRVLAQGRRAGASVIRIDLVWAAVAPQRRPAAFEATDPGDPAYNWSVFDRVITDAVAAGYDPLVGIAWAPAWAEGGGPGDPGTRRVDPVAFGQFARAAATRYSGTFVAGADPNAEPLPRVRNWMAWNEPNRDYYFMPQYEGGRLVSPGLYRSMVNRFAQAVHDVNPSNIVVAGALAPLGKPGKPAPLSFMRAFLSAPVQFDVWAHHPYTTGGPTHSALRPNDVSLGDLGEMRRVLRTAARRGRVVSARRVGFWVTEFSWDSNPPDPEAVPAALHARWVSEALYRMWQNGVSVVTWFRVRDDPLRATAYQSGFYRANGRPKRSLTAFRFPVVAFTRRGGVYVWGRTPFGQPGRVIVQIRSGNRWRRLGTVRARSTGIFSRTYRTPIRRGHVRARFARGGVSVPFSLARVGDRYVNPFGCGGGIRC
jgi:hypothetical protein